jgi:hypothetical protein
MQNNKNMVAASPAAGASGGPAKEPRIVVLNAMPMNALPPKHVRLEAMPVAPSEFVEWVKRKVKDGYRVVHFIRHPSTIQVLRNAGVPISEAPEAGLYRWQEGDVMAVVTLKNPTRGQEQAVVTLDDLAIWLVYLAP